MKTRHFPGIVMISINLKEDGGGVALVSRLMVRATAIYCIERQIPFRVLHLGEMIDTEHLLGLPDLKIRHFYGQQKNMALAIWRCQLQVPRPFMLFDHVGPARPQSYLPPFWYAPYLLFMHGVEVWKHLTWDRSIAVRRARLRLTNSYHTRAVLRELSPWLPATHVLHLALEERIPADDPDHVLLNRVGTEFLLTVGRMSSIERYKGHDELIAAMPQIVQTRPDARLVIVGKGDDMNRLQELAVANGIQNHVVFTGFVNEATLHELYKRCLAFVMPSRQEGFGLVFLEAMRFSKPCVALNHTAPEEIVQHEVTGFLIEDGNTPQLVDVLKRLLSDLALCQRLGQAGYHRWNENFSYRAFQTRFHKYLDLLLERK